ALTWSSLLSTTRSSTAPAATETPRPTTLSMTTAPVPTEAPSSITDPWTRAPAPTAAPSYTLVPPVSTADGSTDAPGRTNASPAGPGRAGASAAPRTTAAQPRTYDSGVPRSRQYASSTTPRTTAPASSKAGNVSRSTLTT